MIGPFSLILSIIKSFVMGEGTFLQNKGGYRKLVVYQITELIYDITYHFTGRFLDKRDRTVDQMIQAARSGKQNIAEGSAASTTSAETEIKLTNVAKASLEELLIDYEDYMRVNNLVQWNENHPRYSNVRRFCRFSALKVDTAGMLPRMNDEEIANMAVTLINQATYMLRRLIESQQKKFLENGGVREQMTRARLDYRKSRGGKQ